MDLFTGGASFCFLRQKGTAASAIGAAIKAAAGAATGEPGEPSPDGAKRSAIAATFATGEDLPEARRRGAGAGAVSLSGVDQSLRGPDGRGRGSRGGSEGRAMEVHSPIPAKAARATAEAILRDGVAARRVDSSRSTFSRSN
jgi:hypothetical protein